MTIPYGKSLLPATVGFDRLLSTLDETFEIFKDQRRTFPPYNIIKHSDDEYEIEIAVAGYDKDDIEIKLDGTYLYIDGKNEKDTNIENAQYLWKGIANRSFQHKFVVSENLEIKQPTLKNGILRIMLNNVAKAKTAKTIPIAN